MLFRSSGIVCQMHLSKLLSHSIRVSTSSACLASRNTSVWLILVGNLVCSLVFLHFSSSFFEIEINQMASAMEWSFPLVLAGKVPLLSFLPSLSFPLSPSRFWYIPTLSLPASSLLIEKYQSPLFLAGIQSSLVFPSLGFLEWTKDYPCLLTGTFVRVNFEFWLFL